ncbi:MAG: hypothetical protein HYV07_30520 [Deltaproteobacteria bacterium]|nr:hypothetical protein [Deltaproteobacteria bacterium]
MPRARGGLLASDHSKRGKRFVTLLDPQNHQVTLLEPWEHSVLVLCDGTRGIGQLAAEMKDSGSTSVDPELVERALKFFERQSLIEPTSGRPSEPPPSPKTLASLQQAYKEWHTEPARTGQYPRPPAFPETAAARPPPGLAPTVALPEEPSGSMVPGSTLAGVSRTDAAPELLDVLGAVDDALGEAEEIERQRRRPNARARKPNAELVVVESRPPDSGVHAKLLSKVEVALEGSRPPPLKARPEEQLLPTTLGAVPGAPNNDPPTQPGAERAAKLSTLEVLTEAAPVRPPPRRRAYSESDEATVEMARPPKRAEVGDPSVEQTEPK